MKNEHTLWKVANNGLTIVDAKGTRICDMLVLFEGNWKPKYEAQKSRAHRIVTAHNCHDELVAMLELAEKFVGKMVADNIQTAMPPEIALERIHTALAHARGEE